MMTLCDKSQDRAALKMTTPKKQLFDTQVVSEIVTAAIISFLIEERNEQSEDVDEDKVAEFVIQNFSTIVKSITNEDNKQIDIDDASRN